VHAEIEVAGWASACARSQGRILYCTTFPCHNCAKHIVAAGIEEVHFIEPYPKSRALELHSDSLALGSARGKVEFHPFVGIGPRRYVELFCLRDTLGSKISRKSKTGRVIEWSAPDAALVVPDRLANYLEMERWAAAQLANVLTPSREGNAATE
jgi:hypothetical protein